LHGHHWPGNVRELRNAVERAVLLCEASAIGPSDLGLSTSRPEGEPPGEGAFRFTLPSGGIPLKEAERRILLAALERVGWVQKEAAGLLGITKRAIHYKIELHGITHTSWTKNRPGGDEG
jgi:DNA-binding NtrC family response regulator